MRVRRGMVLHERVHCSDFEALMPGFEQGVEGARGCLVHRRIAATNWQQVAPEPEPSSRLWSRVGSSTNTANARSCARPVLRRSRIKAATPSGSWDSNVGLPAVLHFLIHKRSGGSEQSLPLNAFFQRICGLPRARGQQETDCGKVY